MSTPTSDITFRQAQRSDLARIVELLANDELGRQREDSGAPLSESYFAAFEAIDADPNNELTIACKGEQVIGVMQLTFIPNITYRGSWRCLIEGVRVDEAFRGRGLGRELINYAIGRARERGCRLVQLTTDKARPGAIAFYESLGFRATHEGMKLDVNND